MLQNDIHFLVLKFHCFRQFFYHMSHLKDLIFDNSIRFKDLLFILILHESEVLFVRFKKAELLKQFDIISLVLVFKKLQVVFNRLLPNLEVAHEL
jgi:hypothetical protein